MSERILLAHGSGGKLARELVEGSILSELSNPLLARLDDSAVLEVSGKLAFTTDSYVVNPIFFPGGDIGRLAVCGTVNDLSMMGAVPLFLSLALILEEGLARDDLVEIIKSVKQASEESGVSVVTGDTKVVGRGSADKLYINTAGIGVVAGDVEISGSRARPGDRIVINGPIGDHGMAVLSSREGFSFSSLLKSDCAPLNGLVADMLAVSRRINCLRDPTRGGLATTLNEIAVQSGAGIIIDEARIPVRDEVRAACEMLGLDPLHVANEGKLVAVVDAEDAEVVVERMRANPYGREAAIIGEVEPERPGKVVMRTRLGSSRIVDMLVGDPLPRIC